jgi:hypothetical protein
MSMLDSSFGLKGSSLYVEIGTTMSSSDITVRKEEGMMWVPQIV